MSTYTLSSYFTGAFAALSLFLAIHVLLRAIRSIPQYPPGPKPLPLLGNVLDMPLKDECLTWQSYVHQYGDIVFLSVFGRKILLLGSHEAIIDLIDKRVTFNSRPRFPMLHDLMRMDWVIATYPYGDRWRQGRKLLHSYARAGAVVKYEGIQLRSARRLIRDLLASEVSRPKDRMCADARSALPQLIRKSFALNAVRIIYGIDVQDSVKDAHYVDVPEKVLAATNKAGIPGQFFVDLIPFLKYIPTWFPGAGFHRFAKQTRELHKQMRDVPIAVTKTQLATGKAPISMVASMLSSEPDQEQLIKDLAGTVYMAGSDTTVAAVTSFFLAAVVYPEIQKRAQEELDRMVGRERLPNFDDRHRLPYLDAVMRECLRWLPVLPLGVAHSTTEDQEYRGYFIPKDTVILPFQWGLLHDPSTYPDPGVFSPERYLTRLADGSWKLRIDVIDPRTFAFGFGRRACPGVHLAEQSLFAILSSALHTLNITRAKERDGRETVPEARTNSGLLCHPVPFAYELRMRESAEKLVEMCIAAAEQDA